MHKQCHPQCMVVEDWDVELIPSSAEWIYSPCLDWIPQLLSFRLSTKNKKQTKTKPLFCMKKKKLNYLWQITYSPCIHNSKNWESLDKLLGKYQVSWINPKLPGQEVWDIRIGIISKDISRNLVFLCQKEKEYKSLMLLFKIITIWQTPNFTGSGCPASPTPVSQLSSHMKKSVSRKRLLAADSTVFTRNTERRISPMCCNYSRKEGNTLWIT